MGVASSKVARRLTLRTEFNTHAMPYEFANRRARHEPGKQGFDRALAGVGGKTMLWNAVALRYSQRDFRGNRSTAAARTGPSDQRTSRLITRRSSAKSACAAISIIWKTPDGDFLPPAPMKCSDLIVKRAPQKLDSKVIHVRKSTLTVAKRTRPACHFLRQLHGRVRRCRCEVQFVRRAIFFGAQDGRARRSPQRHRARSDRVR